MPRTDPTLPSELLDGYRRFRTDRYAGERERYRRLGEGGQQPHTLVVACSDSRSSPEAIFDAGPGELFVVRNVAALVPAYAPDGAAHAASAALEFAVRSLEVDTIVVMGHGRCGGIAAALDPNAPAATDFVGRWVAGVRELAASLPVEPGQDDAARARALEHRSVEHSIDHLRTFPWIAAAEEAGAVRIGGAWFDIALGELHVLTATGWERLIAE